MTLSLGADTVFRRVEREVASAPAPKRGGVERGAAGAVSEAPPVLRLTEQLVRTYARAEPSYHYDVVQNPRRTLTRPEEPRHNHGYDNENYDYILRVHDDITAPDGTVYRVMDLLGLGTFGQVVKCLELPTNRLVAVKVIKSQAAYAVQAMMEVQVLNRLHRDFSAASVQHVVQLLNHFQFRGHLCLVLERLGVSLYDTLKQNRYRGLDVDVLRTVLAQLLPTVDLLARADIIHCDLKPENVLLSRSHGWEVKLIDFGSACSQSDVVYQYVQSRFYRSPEVLLGLNYGPMIDVWSLGCIAGELFVGLPLFPGHDGFNMICRIVEMIGMPPAWMMQQGTQSVHYFSDGALRPAPLGAPGNAVPPPSTAWKRYFRYITLEDIIMHYPMRTDSDKRRELAQRRALVSLIRGMLQWDPRQRWTCFECLQHPFMRGDGMEPGQMWSPPRHGVPRIPPPPSRPAADGGPSGRIAGGSWGNRGWSGLPPASGRAEQRGVRSAMHALQLEGASRKRRPQAEQRPELALPPLPPLPPCSTRVPFTHD